MLGAVLSILELSLLLFVLFECHSFGFFPLFPFAKIIVSLHISSSSPLTVCPHWQGNIRVCWEIRMGRDGFPRTPLSAGCPFHALLFYPQVRFRYWVLCVLPSFCQCPCSWCWPCSKPSTQALSSSSVCPPHPLPHLGSVFDCMSFMKPPLISHFLVLQLLLKSAQHWPFDNFKQLTS